jgi:hypothetical protein
MWWGLFCMLLLNLVVGVSLSTCAQFGKTHAAPTACLKTGYD